MTHICAINFQNLHQWHANGAPMARCAITLRHKKEAQWRASLLMAAARLWRTGTGTDEEGK